MWAGGQGRGEQRGGERGRVSERARAVVSEAGASRGVFWRVTGRRSKRKSASAFSTWHRKLPRHISSGGRPSPPTRTHARASRDVALPRAFSAPPRFDDERPKALAHAPRQPARRQIPLAASSGVRHADAERRDPARTCTSSAGRRRRTITSTASGRRTAGRAWTSASARRTSARSSPRSPRERTRRRRPRRSTRRTPPPGTRRKRNSSTAPSRSGASFPRETPRSRPRRRRRGKRASRSPRWTRTTGTERRDEPRGARRASPERTTGKRNLSNDARRQRPPARLKTDRRTIVVRHHDTTLSFAICVNTFCYILKKQAHNNDI